MSLAVFVGACGGDTEQSASEPAQTTTTDTPRERALQRQVDELKAERRATQRKVRREARERRVRAERRREARHRAQEQAALDQAGGQGTGAGGRGSLVMPDLVGLDHQAAQDALQGERLYLLEEEDCTGQGRLLLFDRSWEVLRTDPPAGTLVSPDSTITLCSKKEGE